ncbi:MAG: histidinol dehydrogenase, partial [Cyclobacteriaceae bacterium]
MLDIIPYSQDNDKIYRILTRKSGQAKEVEESVKKIINEIKSKGDTALFEFTKKFDKVEISSDTIKITEEEIDEAEKSLSKDLRIALIESINNVRKFHKSQLPSSYFMEDGDGIILG